MTLESTASRRQLAGEDLAWDPSIKLRDDISTDEITPVWVCYHYDEKLGEYPYVGLECRGERPIGENDVKNGGFVSGKRRGKGSSREASPFAELSAGIRIVIAENIERIYRENCQNLGLFTSTDFGLIGRIRNGEAIPLSEFTEGADPITKEIIERGGLFAYNEAREQGEVSPPLAKDEVGVSAVKPGDTGFVRTDIRFSHEYVTPMAAGLYRQYTPDAGIREKDSVLLFRDHLGMLDLVISEERRAAGLLDLAGGLAKRQTERLGGDLSLDRLWSLRYPRPGDRWQRFAHAAFRRIGDGRVRRRLDGDRQRLGDPGRTDLGARDRQDRHHGSQAGERDGEGHGAGGPAPAVRERRWSRREDPRVDRSGDRRPLGR